MVSIRVCVCVGVCELTSIVPKESDVKKHDTQ
jgi:hypothetical protein